MATVTLTCIQHDFIPNEAYTGIFTMGRHAKFFIQINEQSACVYSWEHGWELVTSLLERVPRRYPSDMQECHMEAERNALLRIAVQVVWDNTVAIEKIIYEPVKPTFDDGL